MMDELRELEAKITRLQAKVDEIHRLLNGNGKLGIVGMVLVMWRAHTWLVGMVGVAIGAGVTKAVGCF